jgi:hypothetical protein
MEIKLLRLITGEDVLAEIVDAGDVAYQIRNPLIVYIRPTETGVPSVGLSQWIPYSADKEFTIKNDRVVVESNPAEDLRKQYDRVYGSGIIMPSAKLTA